MDEDLSTEIGIPRRTAPVRHSSRNPGVLRTADDSFAERAIGISLVGIIQPNRQIVAALRILDANRILALRSRSVTLVTLWPDGSKTEPDRVSGLQRVAGEKAQKTLSLVDFQPYNGTRRSSGLVFFSIGAWSTGYPGDSNCPGGEPTKSHPRMHTCFDSSLPLEVPEGRLHTATESRPLLRLFQVDRRSWRLPARMASSCERKNNQPTNSEPRTRRDPGRILK